MISFDQAPANDKAHSTAFDIDISGAFKLAEQMEELLLFCGIDAPSSVKYGHWQEILVRVEGWKNHEDATFFAKFHWIFDQVDQYLS